MVRNLIHIQIRILILLLEKLLVLLTFIELLTNHGSGTGVQGMTTAANITKSQKKRCQICKLRLPFIRITSLHNVLADTHFSFLSFLAAHTVPTHSFFVHHGYKCLIYDGFRQNISSCNHKNLSRICKNGVKVPIKISSS